VVMATNLNGFISHVDDCEGQGEFSLRIERGIDDFGAKTCPGGTMFDAPSERGNLSGPGTGKKLPWRTNSNSP
jgi:hypothetical protein